MTSRILPPAEWPRLEGTAVGTALQRLPPEWCRVVVVEDDAGQIVGSWALMTFWHADGAEIQEAHRARGVVAKHLLKGMRELMATEAAAGAFVVAERDDVAAMMTRLGAIEVPGRMFAWPVQSGVG